jgi:hypothetical protein
VIPGIVLIPVNREQIRVRGVDLLEFRDGKIVKKDSYWKIVQK